MITITSEDAKIPSVYNIVIFDSEDLKQDSLKKVFGDIFGYDFIYASQKVLELKNVGRIEFGVFSYDIATTLIKEIKAIVQNVHIELNEVMYNG